MLDPDLDPYLKQLHNHNTAVPVPVLKAIKNKVSYITLQKRDVGSHLGKFRDARGMAARCRQIT
jgi:hypothetical protein